MNAMNAMIRRYGALLPLLLVISAMACGKDKPTQPKGTGDPGVLQQLFYVATGSSHAHPFSLLRVDGKTGGYSVAVPDAGFFTALCYGGDGRLYGIGSHLTLLDPQHGTATRLVGFRDGSSADDILMTAAAMEPGNTLLGLENLGKRVFRINISTGELTVVREENGPEILSAIEYISNEGLYAGCFSLYRLDPQSTEIVREVGPIPDPAGYLCGLSAKPGDGLYALAGLSTRQVIYRVNTSTAAMTEVVVLRDRDYFAFTPVLAPSSGLSKSQDAKRRPVGDDEREEWRRQERRYLEGRPRIAGL